MRGTERGLTASSRAGSHSEAVPDEKLPLSSSMAYAIGGQFGYVLTQMLILAALAQLRGQDAVGEFGIALALTTPFFTLGSMGGRSSQASDVTQIFPFSDYGGLTVYLATFAVIASIAAGVVMTDGHTLLIVVVIALTKAFEAVSNLSYGAFQQAGRVDQVALSLFRRGVITLPIFVGFLLLGAPTGLAFVAQLLVWSACALFFDYPRASRMMTGGLARPNLSPKRVIALARTTAPLGASYFLNSLLVSLPRIIVERMIGISAVGMLTVVTYFQQAGTMLANAISQMLISRVARLRHANAAAALRRNSTIILAFAAACSVLALAGVHFLGEWTLRTFFGGAFGEGQGLLMLVTLAVCAKLFSMVPQARLHADRRFSVFFFRELATVAVCLILLLILVPQLGLIGAGWAILGASVFRLVTMTLVLFASSSTRPAVAGESADVLDSTP